MVDPSYIYVCVYLCVDMYIYLYVHLYVDVCKHSSVYVYISNNVTVQDNDKIIVLAENSPSKNCNFHNFIESFRTATTYYLVFFFSLICFVILFVSNILSFFSEYLSRKYPFQSCSLTFVFKFYTGTKSEYFIWFQNNNSLHLETETLFWLCASLEPY